MIDDITADGVVGDDMVHVGDVPVSDIAEGICTLSCAVDDKLLYVLNDIFNAIGADTTPTSLPTTTLVSRLAVGVIVNIPVAILYPLRDTNNAIDLGEASTKHCITTLVICIVDDDVI